MSDIYFVLYSHPHGIIEFHGDPFYLTSSGGINPPCGNSATPRFTAGSRRRSEDRGAESSYFVLYSHVVADFVSFATAFFTPSLIHFVTPPFQSHPAGLGFFAVSEEITALR